MIKAKEPCDDCRADLSMAGEGYCSRCGWHQTEHRLSAPSQTPEAAGLEDTLFFKLKDLILEQSEGEWTDAMILRDAHHFANNLRPLLAASAQAAIDAEKAKVAELEALLERANATAIKTLNHAEIVDLRSAHRATAAEARADRLAKGLKDAEESARRYARCYEPCSDGRNTFLMLADHIAALQQETQK